MEEKVQYYLDTEDQITIDGHTLSRLYLKEPLKEKRFTISDRDGDYAVYGQDQGDNVYRGGYVESLDSLPKKSFNGRVAWVDENSKVYGDTKISPIATIINTTIADSQITSSDPWTLIAHSTIRNSTISSECIGSIVENSQCTKSVYRSDIKNSKITRNVVLDSKITDSNISSKNKTRIINADLTNVRHIGGIAGTFSDLEPGDLKTHPIYFTNGKLHKTNQLIIGPNNELALYNDIENEYNDYEVMIPAGDISKQDLLDFLQQPTEKGTVGNAKSIEFVKSLPEKEMGIDDIVSGLSELDDLSDGIQR